MRRTTTSNKSDTVQIISNFRARQTVRTSSTTEQRIAEKPVSHRTLRFQALPGQQTKIKNELQILLRQQNSPSKKWGKASKTKPNKNLAERISPPRTLEKNRSHQQDRSRRQHDRKNNGGVWPPSQQDRQRMPNMLQIHQLKTYNKNQFQLFRNPADPSIKQEQAAIVNTRLTQSRNPHAYGSLLDTFSNLCPGTNRQTGWQKKTRTNNM